MSRKENCACIFQVGGFFTRVKKIASVTEKAISAASKAALEVIDAAKADNDDDNGDQKTRQ